MKKIAYSLILLSSVIFFHACEEENYKDMNITTLGEEIDVKQFTEGLTSHIVIMNVDGEEVTDVDMGETFYIIDNTEGGTTETTWEITEDKLDSTYTRTETFERLALATPGDVTIKLTSARSSDGESISSTANLTVNFIPITTMFLTTPSAVDNIIEIQTGDTIAYTDNSTVLPTIFDWAFDGGTPETGDQSYVVVQYNTPGEYDLSYTATRYDGDEEITDNVSNTGYVKVTQRVVELIRAVATDHKIELQFDEPMMHTVTDEAMGEFSLKINTLAGEEIIPSITTIEVTGDSSITITFDNKMYSDDKLLLSFTPTGLVTDECGLHTPVALIDEPCVYGHAMVFGDMEDQSIWVQGSGTQDTDGYFDFVDENSAEYPMTPYQGRSCMFMLQGSAGLSACLTERFDVEEGDVFEFAYEALRTSSVSGALERRISTQPSNNSNDAGGNWMSANKNGNGNEEWVTVTKTINVSADTKGQVGTLHFVFMRYSGAATDVLWFDNVRIYEPNPRP